MLLSQWFLEPGFVWWFALLIPLIILYLVRPKPMDQTIPSLMFLLQEKGSAIRNSLLRYLYKDFVFLLQFLIIALLVAAACEPYITISKGTLVGNTVLVLDASASMQTADDRWDEAIAAALQRLSRQNTIILVQNRPVIIAEDMSKGDAERLLKTLSPKDTETNLYAGVLAAREYAPNADSRVVIISDFIDTNTDQDYAAAIRAVQASGAAVELVQVGSAEVSNVGIISLAVAEDKTNIGIKNFDAQTRSATLRAGSFSEQIEIPAGATEVVTINTPVSVTEVKIDVSDDFELDNIAYISNNPDLLVRMLVITNNPQFSKSAFGVALQSIHDKTPLDVEITLSTPPQLVTVDHDIVVFADVNPQLLVQRVVRETSDKVKQGRSAIILYQSDMWGIDYEGMLPFSYKGAGGQTRVLPGEFSPITKDVEFGDVPHHFIIEGDAQTLAASAEQTPLIAQYKVGAGSVLYYGLDDRAGTFRTEPYYPVFWKRVLDSLEGRETLSELNIPTGAVLPSEPEKTPQNAAVFGFADEQGIYELSDRTLAVNVLSAKESTVAISPIDEEIQATVAQAGQDALKQKELAATAALVALICIFLELFIVKFRGDF